MSSWWRHRDWWYNAGIRERLQRLFQEGHFLARQWWRVIRLDEDTIGMFSHFWPQTIDDIEAFGQLPCNGVANERPDERYQTGQHPAVQFRIGHQWRFDSLVPLSCLSRNHFYKHHGLSADVRTQSARVGPFHIINPIGGVLVHEFDYPLRSLTIDAPKATGPPHL